MKHETFIMILMVPVLVGIFYLAFRPQITVVETSEATTGTDE